MFVGVTVLGAAVILAAHAISPFETHVTRFEEQAGGLAGVFEIRGPAPGRVRPHRSEPVRADPVLGLPIAIAAVLRPPTPLRPSLQRSPAWRDAILVTLLAGVVAYLVNDSGPAAAASRSGWAWAASSACRSCPKPGRWGVVSSQPPIPPRPDGLHPVPLMPPRPDTLEVTDDLRPKASWSWYEALVVYIVAFLIAGLATLPLIRLMEPETDLTNIVLTTAAALVIPGVLLLWLSTYHRGWLGVMRSPNRERGARRSVRASCSHWGCTP